MESKWNLSAEHEMANFSHVFPPNITFQPDMLTTARRVIYRIIIPVICAFGVISNCVNLCAFSRRWRKRNTTSSAKAAMVGILSLSVSDLLFCSVGVPAAFLDLVAGGGHPLSTGAFYYVTYRGALFNVTLFSSTWCIVLISLERYMAICHPFQARIIIRVWKSLLMHVAVAVCAVLISLPEFLKYTIDTYPCANEHICHFKVPQPAYITRTFLVSYKLLWAIVGTFVPLGVMIFCNVRLLAEIYRSRSDGLADPDRYCTTKLTITVTGIISMFLVLVCPSMILSFVDTVFFLQDMRENIHELQIAMLITNLMQAVKFSCNIFLYCAINSQFREALSCAKKIRTASRASTESTNKVEMTLLK